ncbi:RimJ/RimL family protein N-acetyltransferase [Thioclava sp. ES.031]|uniref:GNAT family N-acetyltransferase n=1 Tax=Thioclava sp. ES.031 TaxID=1798203 RepID=UPI000BF8DED8|nr:GNAT family N-acetyltransferase [Thioclava sp. ES.031]PFG63784.1 RimJ/RimL family protein N-acetyltransferase [Thioclava sp. ES.031]
MHLIETPRLVLRPLTSEDVDAIARAANDFEVARWLTRMPHPYSKTDAEALVAANRENFGRVWGITRPGDFCGLIGKVGAFGYWLGRDHWGNGYATEAGRAVIAVHFEAPDARPLAAGYFEGNHRSRRVLEKLGFRTIGESLVDNRALGRKLRHFDMICETPPRDAHSPSSW